jgi:hypothetical protein
VSSILKDSLFWRIQQVGVQVGKVQWCSEQLYWKIRPLVGLSDYRKYIGPRPVRSILVYLCSYKVSFHLFTLEYSDEKREQQSRRWKTIAENSVISWQVIKTWWKKEHLENQTNEEIHIYQEEPHLTLTLLTHFFKNYKMMLYSNLWILKSESMI